MKEDLQIVWRNTEGKRRANGSGSGFCESFVSSGLVAVGGREHRRNEASTVPRDKPRNEDQSDKLPSTSKLGLKENGA